MQRIIDNEKKNLIGENLKKIRKEKSISQKELSEKLETVAVYVCRGSISRIEDCTRTVTDIELKAIADVLNVSVTDLLS